MASSRYLFCAICGGPLSASAIEIEDHERLKQGLAFSGYDDKIIAESDCEWLDKYRVLSTKDDNIPLDPSIRLDDTLAISAPAWWEEWAAVFIEGSSQQYSIFNTLRQPGIFFRVVLHDACLDITHRVIRDRHAPPQNLLQIYQAIKKEKLVDQSRESNVLWKHGYYGAIGQWGQAWVSSRGYEWIVADPMNGEDATAMVLSKLNQVNQNASPSPETQISDKSAKTSLALSVLEKLPSPALDQVLAFLDVSSTLKLRRCSSAMHNVIPFTERFWRDHLIKGDAVPWLWDLKSKDIMTVGLEQNWRLLVKELLDNPNFEDDTYPLHIRNRMRIWRIISEIHPRQP